MNQTNKCSQIFVKDIENGMVIGRDVLDSGGNLLLSQGFKVGEAYKIKRLLNQHSILFVSIIKQEEPTTIKKQNNIDSQPAPAPIQIDANSKEIIKSINKFNKNKDVLKESFNKFSKGEAIKPDEIEQEIKDTLDIFKGNINVFQLMQRVKHLDDATYSHCHNVALISYSIGQWLDLNEKDLMELALSGILIDIGKIKIDHNILNKEGKFTNEEFIEMKKHSIYSHEMIKEYEFISERVKRAVLCHHERIDGSGYPLGLKGHAIPLFSRILAVADVYNALISHRPHRTKKTPFEAIRILETEYMDKLDPNILYLFLRRVASNYIGQKVRLSNGTSGEIVFIPKHNIFRPVIKLENEEQILDLGSHQYKYISILEFC